MDHKRVPLRPRAGFLRNTMRLLGDALEAWYRYKAPRLGASLAFYTILSLAPLLMVLIAIASMVSGPGRRRRPDCVADSEHRRLGRRRSHPADV